MSQLSIYFPKFDKTLFLSFWNKFENSVSKYKNVCIGNNDDSIELKVSLASSKKIMLFSEIKILLAECMVVFYKTKYFENNLAIPFKSEIEKKAFNKALAIFDKKADIDQILSIIELKEFFNVESFYNFQLTDLKCRWEDICILFRENLGYLLSTTGCLELIKYLIDITDNEYESVYLYNFENNIILRDKNGKQLFAPISVIDDCFIIEIIADLISLAPKNICPKFDISKYPELNNSINYIFDKKIVFDA